MDSFATLFQSLDDQPAAPVCFAPPTTGSESSFDSAAPFDQERPDATTSYGGMCIIS
uniref:Putative pheromone n=1 Tax=Flammulina velutipes TaxID=38945 RepID=A0A1B2U709_FLAVE|nr:putative pheromone precursor [Flammulina velutipes]